MRMGLRWQSALSGPMIKKVNRILAKEEGNDGHRKTISDGYRSDFVA